MSFSAQMSSSEKGGTQIGCRRVVTGHSPDGKAIVASDAEVDPITGGALFPGFELYDIWASDGAPRYPDDGSPLPSSTWFPPAGGFRFFRATIPPDETPAPESFDEQAAVADLEAQAPGLLATFEPENPGFHTSDTVDVIYVASGSVVLELDDGAEIELNAGETIVQSGTRHAWRNPSNEPCTIVAVSVGAHRSS